MIWLIPPTNLAIDSTEVHVWRVGLDRSEDEVTRLAGTLSPDERERAARLIVDGSRRRWIVARGVLRSILGRYTGLPPEEIRFRFAARGKPSLEGSRNVNSGELRSGSDRATTLTQTLSRPKGHPERDRDIDVRFNLSHSGNLALIAVTRNREVGVDVESARADRDLERIATRFFSKVEVATLQALPPSERTQAFYRCWTRKEAFIKAVGDGLAIPLDSFDVAFAPGSPADLLANRHAPDEVRRWTMAAIDPGPGYVAALVVEGDGWKGRFLEGHFGVVDDPLQLG